MVPIGHNRGTVVHKIGIVFVGSVVVVAGSERGGFVGSQIVFALVDVSAGGFLTIQTAGIIHHLLKYFEGKIHESGSKIALKAQDLSNRLLKSGGTKV